MLEEGSVSLCLSVGRSVVDVKANRGDKMALNQNHSEAGGVIVNNSER